LTAGFTIGQLVRSPTELAAETAIPPDGLITARIEARTITSTVVARADIIFDDPIRINPTAPEGTNTAVVTGQVPQPGATINPGDVVLEVSGRPVFVLPGSFKAYRSIGPGSSGPDVTQLRTALKQLGFNAGSLESNTYDAALAGAVQAFYKQAGYPPPGSEDQTLTRAVRDARDAVTDAKDTRTQAAKDLATANNTVKTATPDTITDAKTAADAARTALNLAERALQRAQETLTDTERAAWTTMPVSEVVFVTDLPRRVDQTNIKVGDDLGLLDTQTDPVTGMTGPVAAVVLSGAEINVTARVNLDEATLLAIGGPAVLSIESTEITGQITNICDTDNTTTGSGTDVGPTCEIGITVEDLGGLDPETVVGNVLATMVVGATSPDTLVVPLAAVSADTAGNARIEIVDGELAKDQPATAQHTRTVNIKAGLTAQGMVEIKSADINLKAGTLVVIGQGKQTPTPTPTPSRNN
jgi:peptidoglycan hydrolase-like protein with peptidoglycan-binding domain